MASSIRLHVDIRRPRDHHVLCQRACGRDTASLGGFFESSGRPAQLGESGVRTIVNGGEECRQYGKFSIHLEPRLKRCLREDAKRSPEMPRGFVPSDVRC